MAMCFPASISGRMSFANAQNVLDDNSLHAGSHRYERSESERKVCGLMGRIKVAREVFADAFSRSSMSKGLIEGVSQTGICIFCRGCMRRVAAVV